MAIKPLILLDKCKGLHTGVASIRVKYDTGSGATFLQACSNVVVDRAGRITRRDGAVLKNAQAMLSIFSDGIDCVGQTNTALFRIAADYTLTGLRDLTPGHKMYYAKSPEGIFYTNGVERGRVARFGLSMVWDRGVEEYSPVKTLIMSGPPEHFKHMHYNNGRLFVAVDKTVYYSDYRSYGNFYLERDMLQYPDKVIGFASSVKTLFVFTEKHVFSYPGPSMQDAVESVASNIPLLEGTVAYNDSINSEFSTLPMWMTKNGLYVGFPDGQARNVTEGRLILPDTAGRGKASCNGGQYIAILDY